MDKFELYYQFTQAQINEQNERVKSYHENARHLMTLSIALLGITGLMITSFVLSNLFSIKVVFLGLRYIGAHPKELRSNIRIPEYEDDALVKWTADAMTKAYCLNEETITRKAFNITWAMIFFWFEVLFVISFAMSILLIDSSVSGAR